MFEIVIVVCTIYGGLRLPFLLLIVATIFVLHSAIGHKEYRYISPALPVLMTLAGIGSVLAAEQLAERLGRPAVQRALMVAVPLAWTVASIGLATSPDRIWYWVRSRGSILGPRYQRRQESLRRRNLSQQFMVAVRRIRNLQHGIPLYAAGNGADPIAPNAYNYVLSLQLRNKEQKIDDLPADFTHLGYEQVRCWSTPTAVRCSPSALAFGAGLGLATPHRRSCSPRMWERSLRPWSARWEGCLDDLDRVDVSFCR